MASPPLADVEVGFEMTVDFLLSVVRVAFDFDPFLLGTAFDFCAVVAGGVLSVSLISPSSLLSSASDVVVAFVRLAVAVSVPVVIVDMVVAVDFPKADGGAAVGPRPDTDSSSP